MGKYRAALVGCGRMGGSIDDEVLKYEACILPYCHAGAYAAIPNITLVAAADMDPIKLEMLSRRWSVPNRYTDYREMIEREKPDIVSVTTPATSHAEVAVFAAEMGAKGIYCEKAMCCSMIEADAIVGACERNGVKFNLGTTRRYHPGYEVMRKLVADGEIGAPRAAVSYMAGSLMHTHSHTFDLLLYLLGDPEVECVQGRLDTDLDPSVSRYGTDPTLGMAYVRFRNGLDAHWIGVPGVMDYEVLGTAGTVRAMNNNIDWHLRKTGRKQGRWQLLDPVDFPPFERKSPTVRCIEDLIEAIETGRQSRGNVYVARAGMEIALGIAESHRQDGARVHMPLKNRELHIASR